jgi:ABC-2 type transport system permease protein
MRPVLDRTCRLVPEREVGTLEQLNVTPLGRLQLILGKLLPYGAIGMIDAMIVLVLRSSKRLA